MVFAVVNSTFDVMLAAVFVNKLNNKMFTGGEVRQGRDA
jgi:hypothetical protein